LNSSSSAFFFNLHHELQPFETRFHQVLHFRDQNSIAITADDSITKKFPVLEDGPLEVALFWCTQFDELAQLKNFNAANKFISVLLLLSGDAKDKWINAYNDVMSNNKILLKLASAQCGLPSLSTMEHLTKPPKEYKTFYERPRNPLI
jgi:hypothetical protein